MMTETKRNRVVLATGGRFHAPSLAREFYKKAALRELIVCDRRFRAPSGVPGSAYANRFDLACWGYLQRFINVGYTIEKRSRIYEEWMANRLTKQPAGILHAWSGVAHTAFTRLAGTGWLRCVERSCPHNMVQYELLKEESDLLGLRFTEDLALVQRAVEELYLADVIVAPSSYSARSYVDPELIKKLRVNTLGSNYAVKERTGNPNGKLIVLLVGNAFLRKGTHYLIEAFKLIEDPQAELWVRGHVPEGYRSRITDPRVKIIGDVLPSKLEEIYRSATVFVQSSIDEGFGMTVLEALAYGLPLVVTENVGARDVLTDEVAVTVPIRNPEALAHGILEAQKLPSDSFDIARKCILINNSWEACANRMLNEVYKPPAC
jgi:glycosyltransferase involved in cell wall biosynthesis